MSAKQLSMLNNTELKYLNNGIKAHGHTPVYKMHKYFARRPHNVFRNLVEFYTNKGDIILDPFCGGGVTVFEGLCVGRKVIGVDVNPLATFITDVETTHIAIDAYQHIMREIWMKVNTLTQKFYTTQCPDCNNTADVRWYELAYKARCNHCGSTTILDNAHKKTTSEKTLNGVYFCEECKQSLSASTVQRMGYELLTVTYKCKCKTGRQTKVATSKDLALMDIFEKDFQSLAKEYNLWFPDDLIPETWDRQLEDGLIKKSVFRFTDLFTKRSLFFNGYIFSLIRSYRENIDDSLYKILLFTFSAIIRHTNNMTISTSSWMDGRPVSWAKHAYWIPNQFVEVNPIEYVEKRQKAIVSGMRFQNTELPEVHKGTNFEDLKKNASHIIWTQSSYNLDLPDNSIDAVITDPPYGSNVQYGELSHFWLVWLRDELSMLNSLFNLDNEVLVHRKAKKANKKDYAFYLGGMLKIFSECYRVLKPNGVLVFTFNNKDLKAWFAVIKAAIKAGFYLDPRGVIYQDPIDNYKNTAHLRFAGAMQGDFIYTFRKIIGNELLNPESNAENFDLQEQIINAAAEYLTERESATTSELYIHLIPKMIPAMVAFAQNDEDFSNFASILDMSDLEVLFQKELFYDVKKKNWRLDTK